MPASEDPGPFSGDATRRTFLANERTYLAWWRTGLTAFAVSLGVGKIVPDLSRHGATRWPYVAVGVGFAVLGIAFVAQGMARRSSVERALARGGYSHADARFLGFLTALGVILGLATLVIVLIRP